MLVVIALCNSALARRGERTTGDDRRTSVRTAAASLAPIVADHQVVIGHGDGPQTALLTLEGAAYAKLETYPRDVLEARIDETIGYMIEQDLATLLPPERPVATVLTTVEVDPDDPAFKYPTKPIGPLYLREEAEHIAVVKGWSFKPDGDKWRRVVASPEPTRLLELRPIKWLLERNTVVIAAGGGGIPTMHEKGTNRRRAAVECVVDKDLAWELLARELGADLFVVLTGADAVYVDWGKPSQRAIRRVSPAFLTALPFAARSMRPKVAAACRFATETGKPAAIGALADLERILTGEAGTTISIAEPGITYAASPSLTAAQA